MDSGGSGEVSGDGAERETWGKKGGEVVKIGCGAVRGGKVKIKYAQNRVIDWDLLKRIIKSARSTSSSRLSDLPSIWPMSGAFRICASKMAAVPHFPLFPFPIPFLLQAPFSCPTQ